MALPHPVIGDFGYALMLAQRGKKHQNAKPLKGFGSSAIIEICEEHSGGAYRAIYTVHLPPGIFVLHVFQKKSKQDIATPKRDLDLIKSRLKLAETIAKEMKS